MDLLSEIKKNVLSKPFIDLHAIERDLALAKAEAKSRTIRDLDLANKKSHAELVAGDIKRFEDICERITKVQSAVVDAFEKIQKEISENVVEERIDESSKIIEGEFKKNAEMSDKNWSDLSKINKKMLKSISQLHVDLIGGLDKINKLEVSPVVKFPEMPKFPKIPKVDLTGIDGKLDSLLEDAPKEWEFEVIRDGNGLINRVVAQEL